MAESSRGEIESECYSSDPLLQPAGVNIAPAVKSSSEPSLWTEVRRASADGGSFADAVSPPSLPKHLDLSSPSSDDNSVMGLLLSRAGLTSLRSPSSASSTLSSPSEDIITAIPTGASVIGITCTAGAVDERPEYVTPIVGYEVMEERARFTVFKVKVEHQITGRHWYVFRRYTDFLRLNRKLKTLFPGLRFSLPPKRWFGDNFDPLFLEDRLLGLQAFVNNLMAHKEISKSFPVRDFFCLDDPPGPDDGIEESRALCESLEDSVIYFQHLMKEKDKEVELLKAEVAMLRSQQQALLKSLKMQCSISSLALSRLSSSARSMSVSLNASSSGSGEHPTIPFGHLLQVHCFNLAFGEIIERTIATLSDSKTSTKAVLDKVLEESSTSCDDTQVPITASAQVHDSISQKTFSLEDISSRSTGDGSTGSQERLTPVGGSLDNHFINEAQRIEHKLDSLPEIPMDKVTFKAMLAKDNSIESTPKKCAILAMTPNITTVHLNKT